MAEAKFSTGLRNGPLLRHVFLLDAVAELDLEPFYAAYRRWIPTAVGA